jgi:hypothetical protein
VFGLQLHYTIYILHLPILPRLDLLGERVCCVGFMCAGRGVGCRWSVVVCRLLLIEVVVVVEVLCFFFSR